jgi:hypothetical protein
LQRIVARVAEMAEREIRATSKFDATAAAVEAQSTRLRDLIKQLVRCPCPCWEHTTVRRASEDCNLQLDGASLHCPAGQAPADTYQSHSIVQS